MKAARFHGIGDVRVETCSKPEVQANQVKQYTGELLLISCLIGLKGGAIYEMAEETSGDTGYAREITQ